MAAFPEEISSLLIKFLVNEGQKISNLVILLQNGHSSLITKKLRTLHREVTKKSNRKKKINGLSFL